MRKKNLKFMPAKLRKKIRNSPKYWGSLFDWINTFKLLPSSYFPWLHYDADKYVVSDDDLPF